MYVDVIPLLRLPLSFGAFTYEAPETLAPHIRRGAFVLVPFRRKKVWGVVMGTAATTTLPHRSIRSIFRVRTDGAVSDAELDVVERTASVYRHGLASTAYALLPLPPATERVSRSPSVRIVKSASAPTWVVAALACPGDVVGVIHIQSQRLAAITDLARVVLRKRQSLLVLTPHRAWLDVFARALAAHLPTVVVDRTDAKGAAWAAFQRAHSAPAVILATRAGAAIAPTSLGAIVVDEAHHDDLKSWDAHPRYDARVITAWVAATLQIPRLLLSPAPRIEEWVRARQRIDLGVPASAAASDPLVVDLRAHWRSGERGYLSDALRNAIMDSLARNAPVLVLHNRRGRSQRIVCTDCSATLMCPTCAFPLRAHADGARCHRCAGPPSTYERCPACGSPHLMGRGIGTVGIAELLAKEYPNARIARVDRERADPPPRHANIVVASLRFLASFAPTWERPFGCVAVPIAEQLVLGTDYRASERILQALGATIAWGRTWRAQVIVQALDPQHPAVASAASGSFAPFYRAEFEERRTLQFPPETRILLASARTDRASEGDATQLRRLLEQQFHATLVAIDDLGVTSRTRTDTRSLCIRLRGDVADDEIAAVQAAIPSEWSTDLDPVELP